MSSKYPLKSETAARVSELPTVSATELKNSTSDVLDLVRTGSAIAITRHDKPKAVLLSIDQYEALSRQEPSWLKDLTAEYRVMLDRMQDPEQKEAALRLFQATPEELGAAAVRAAQRQATTHKA